MLHIYYVAYATIEHSDEPVQFPQSRHCSLALTNIPRRIYIACADPETFVREDQPLTFFILFFS